MTSLAQCVLAFVVMCGYVVGAGLLIVFLAAVYDWLTCLFMGDVDGEQFEPSSRHGIRPVRR